MVSRPEIPASYLAPYDRDAIVRLVYGTRGSALWGNVGPGNRMWINTSIPHPSQFTRHCAQLLKSAGFSWNQTDSCSTVRQQVEFSIITSSSNTQRMKMATLLAGRSQPSRHAGARRSHWSFAHWLTVSFKASTTTQQSWVSAAAMPTPIPK